MKAHTWVGALSLVVGCASADSRSPMRAETAAPGEGSVSVADCERFCGPQTPIADDNWCRCESVVASSPAVRRTLYPPAASKRVTSGATCASQADCQGAHESCVRSDPTSTTGHCQSVRVPRDENRRARVKPSGQHRRVTCLRFVQEYRGQRIVTDGKLYGVEGELPTDCRYLNVKGGTRSHRLGGLHRAAQEAGAPAPYCPQFSKMKSASASHVSGPVPTTMAAFCAAGGPSRRAYRANPKKPVAG